MKSALVTTVLLITSGNAQLKENKLYNDIYRKPAIYLSRFIQ